MGTNALIYIPLSIRVLSPLFPLLVNKTVLSGDRTLDSSPIGPLHGGQRASRSYGAAISETEKENGQSPVCL